MESWSLGRHKDSYFVVILIYQSTQVWLEIDSFDQNEELGFKTYLALYDLAMPHGDKDLSHHWFR